MKKLLISSIMILAIGSIAFAVPEPEFDPKPLPPHLHKMQKMERHRRDPEMEKVRIMIDESKLQIRKELLNENPDWNKIEKLNIDIATQEAKLKTRRMRESYEAKYPAPPAPAPIENKQ